MSVHNQLSFLRLLHPREIARSLWTNRALLAQFTLRNVELRHRGSYLGFAWAVLNPLLMLALYVFVFGFVFDGRFGVTADESRWDYGLGIFLGLAVFHMIGEAVSTAPSIITGNPNFVKKVVFPLEVLPAAAVGAAAFHMLISLGMVIIGVVLGGNGLSVRILLLPVIVAPMIGFTLGLAWMVAALGVFFRDIGQVVGALVTALMFASAIFYPASGIPDGAWMFLQFNPLIHTIEMARDVVLWDRPIAPSLLAALYLGSLAAATFGFAAFARLKRAFADVI